MKLGLWFVPYRAPARVYYAVALLLAAAWPVLARVTGNALFYLGCGFALWAAWYAAAINWLESNGTCEERSKGDGTVSPAAV